MVKVFHTNAANNDHYSKHDPSPHSFYRRLYQEMVLWIAFGGSGWDATMSIICILFSICTNPWQWMTAFASMAFSVAQRMLAPWITLASLTLIAVEFTAFCIVGASVTVLYGAVYCTVHGYRLEAGWTSTKKTK